MVGNLLLRIGNNEDIFEAIRNFVKEHNIKTALFVGAKGSIKEFELVVNERRALLNRQKHDGLFDVNSVSGKIQIVNNNPDISLKANVSKTGFSSLSGQLVSGKAASFFELEIKNIGSAKMIVA